MTDHVQRITDEFRRLDDELSAAVTLPQVDSVISRAGALSRATTAAAAAVITVGALGGVTVMAHATPQTAGGQDATVRPAAPSGGQPVGAGFAPAPGSESVTPAPDQGSPTRARSGRVTPDVTSLVPVPPLVEEPPPLVEEPPVTMSPLPDPGTKAPSTKPSPPPKNDPPPPKNDPPPPKTDDPPPPKTDDPSTPPSAGSGTTSASASSSPPDDPPAPPGGSDPSAAALV